MKRQKGHDIYNKSPCLRTTLNIFFVIYVISFLAFGALLTNASFMVSICEPGGGPCTGLVFTDIGSSISWIATSMLGLKLFFWMAYGFNLGFGRNKICSNVWLSLILIIWASQIIAWVFLFSNWVNCNKLGDPSNICTDQQACLVPEFFQDPIVNRCPNSPFGARTYTLQMNNLEVRPDFKWLFGASTLITFFVETILVFLIFVIWCGLSKW